MAKKENCKRQFSSLNWLAQAEKDIAAESKEAWGFLFRGREGCFRLSWNFILRPWVDHCCLQTYAAWLVNLQPWKWLWVAIIDLLCMYIRMPYNGKYFIWKLSELVSYNEKYKLFTKFHLRTPPKELLLVIFLWWIKTKQLPTCFIISTFSHFLFVEVVQALLKDVANNYFIMYSKSHLLQLHFIFNTILLKCF